MLGGWPIAQPVELDDFAWLGSLEEQLAIVEAIGVNQILFFLMHTMKRSCIPLQTSPHFLLPLYKTRQCGFQGGVARSYLGSPLLGNFEGAVRHAKGKRIPLPVYHELLPGRHGLRLVGGSGVSPESQQVDSSPQHYCGAFTTGLNFSSRS